MKSAYNTGFEICVSPRKNFIEQLECRSEAIAL